MEFDPHHPSSRSTPDSTDFEKVEREDVMEAAGYEPDSSTNALLDEALRGGGDAPSIKLESPTASNSEDAASTVDGTSRDLFAFLDSLPSWALDVLYWHHPYTTGLVFLSCFSVLLCLSVYSAVTVASYVAISVLTVTFSFVTYRKCLSAVRKTRDGNPFQAYLAQDFVDKMNQDCQQCLEKVVLQAAACASALRHYFLIVDVFDSLKFSVFLWTLTYIGAWFNLLTLLILCVVSIFTLPKIYQVHHEQIDAGIGMLGDKLAAQYPIVRGKFVDTFGGAWAKFAALLTLKPKSQ